MKHSEQMTHLSLQLCSDMEDTVNAHRVQLFETLKNGCNNVMIRQQHN